MVTRAYVLKRLEAEVKRLRYGCGNHGCVVAPPGDVGTNGGCFCGPRGLRWRLLKLVDHLPETERSWPDPGEISIC